MKRLALSGDYVVATLEDPPIKDGAVMLENEKVVAIGPSVELLKQYPGAALIGGAGHVVIPGLIDAHQHGRGITNIQRGVGDGFLEQWLVRLRGLWPMDPYLATAAAAMRLLRSGVTTAMHHFASTGVVSLRDEMSACLRAYRDVGLRVTFTLDFRDRHSYIYAPDDEFLAGLSAELARSIRDHLPPRVLSKPGETPNLLPEVQRAWASSKLRLAVGPQGGDWSSDAELQEIAEFARHAALPIHTHMLETRLQRQASLRQNGVTQVERFRKFGLLSPETSLAHMVWADRSDLDIVRDTGAVIVHNPASNLRLRSGIAPVLAMLDRDIPVALGMDGMSISDQGDYFQDLRLCASLHFNSSGAVLSPDQLWRMLYDGGSKATFWGEQIGRLTPGCWGDAVVIQMSRGATVAPLDPEWRVMDRVLREGSPSAIRAVVVGGSVVVNNGVITSADEPALLDAIREHAERVDIAALGKRRRLVKELEDAVVGYYRGSHWSEGEGSLNCIRG